MNLQLKGTYEFKLTYTNMFMNKTVTLLKGCNLITFMGESFFLNRPINDNHSPISHIGLGNGRNRPDKFDEKLGNETARKTCYTKADLDNHRILLTSKFPGNEVLGTREIGVFSNDLLLSHDLYDKIDNSIVTSNIGEITIEYSFNFKTSSIRGNWVKKLNKNVSEDYEQYNIYYVSEPNNVIGVFEQETNSGYKKVYGVDALKSNVNKASYYYDNELKLLYIRTTDSNNPNDYNIYVETE